MKQLPIFNPQGNDSPEYRQIWKGDGTSLIQLNQVRYSWAVKLYSQMRDNFWVPQKIDLTQDVTDYQNLTEAERRAYDGVLSYLTFLDSVQTHNLPHLKSPVTAPEVSLCLAEQISQEAMHNQSYQYIIETIVPASKRNAIYEKWREDKALKKRCRYIAKFYQRYINRKSDKNYLLSLIANYILEGLYFYNGFIFFYNLGSRQLMPGTNDMIRMIHRDERTHVVLHQKLVEDALKHPSFKGLVDEAELVEMFRDAADLEEVWSHHIIGDDVLGMTKQSSSEYTRHLASLRAKAIGLPSLYPGEEYKSPYTHLERTADLSSGGEVKGNFFEATVTSYVMSSGVQGWDEF